MSSGVDMAEGIELDTNWEDVICPICLDYPHNALLLQCSSYDKGCRPFVCNTDQFHSNCMDRFKTAHGISQNDDNSESKTEKPMCPLCRGEVLGWVVVHMARVHLDDTRRSCEQERCLFTGTYLELQQHARQVHPHAHPSKVDPARQLDWENFQQSSEIIDVLSTIHSEVPRGVVLGDYVIEYGDDDSADELEDFPGDEGNWWTSCILYQVFDNFRSCRNRRRSSRATESSRGSRRLSHDTLNSDEGSLEFGEYRIEQTRDEFMSTSELSRARDGHRSSRRRRSRFHDN